MSCKTKKCPCCGKWIPSYSKECYTCGYEFYSSCNSACRSSKDYSPSYLTASQRKVKALGSTITCNVGSKRMAKDILVDDYGFDESTAKYAVGYKGY
jgi:hypothetical protein